jgi:hypothetical protein
MSETAKLVRPKDGLKRMEIILANGDICPICKFRQLQQQLNSYAFCCLNCGAWFKLNRKW